MFGGRDSTAEQIGKNDVTRGGAWKALAQAEGRDGLASSSTLLKMDRLEVVGLRDG